MLTKQEDESVLASGPSENTDSYEVTFKTQLKDITGIRLEALPHDSLPGKGAGRGEKGGFVLTTFEVEAKAAGQSQASERFETPILSDWHSLGPFKADSQRQAFSKAFISEGEVDLAKTYDEGQLKWIQQPNWNDGAVHPLAGENSATYLFRTITARHAQQVMALIGSGDGVQVWLNGRRVFANDVIREVEPDQDRVRLRLASGENKLLLKINNASGSSGFSFALMKSPVTEHAVDFERAVADFNRSGFNVMAALDDQTATGWSLGEPDKPVVRNAYFLSRQPFGFSEGTEIKIRMKYESAKPQHALGRFRIAATGSDRLNEFASLPDYARRPDRAARAIDAATETGTANLLPRGVRRRSQVDQKSPGGPARGADEVRTDDSFDHGDAGVGSAAGDSPAGSGRLSQQG